MNVQGVQRQNDYKDTVVKESGSPGERRVYGESLSAPISDRSVKKLKGLGVRWNKPRMELGQYIAAPTFTLDVDLNEE